MKISLVFCSAPLRQQPDSSSTAVPPLPFPDSLDIQLKLYSLNPQLQLVYRTYFWLVDYSSPLLPTSHLLSQHVQGSAAIFYVVRSGCRTGLERLLSALSYPSPPSSSYLRCVLLLPPAPSSSSSVSSSSSSSSPLDPSPPDAVRRAALQHGLLIFDGLSQSPAVDESGFPSFDLGSSQLDAIFRLVVDKLDLAAVDLYRDPTFLLGKNVQLGDRIVSDEGFLTALFNSPA